MRSGDELQLQLVEEYRERLAKKQQEQKKRQQEQQQQERLLWCACHRTGMQSCRVAIANGQITIESLLDKAEKAARLNVSEDRERERERRQKDRE